jgi:hypothetical protein
MPQIDATLDEDVVASIQRATAALKACVRLARSNTEGLRQVVDSLERCYLPERPTLHVVQGGDDA